MQASYEQSDTICHRDFYYRYRIDAVEADRTFGQRHISDDFPLVRIPFSYGSLYLSSEEVYTIDYIADSIPSHSYNVAESLENIHRACPLKFGYTLRSFHSGLALPGKYEEQVFFLGPDTEIDMNNEVVRNALPVSLGALSLRTKNFGYADIYRAAGANFKRVADTEHTKFLVLGMKPYFDHAMQVLKGQKSYWGYYYREFESLEKLFANSTIRTNTFRYDRVRDESERSLEEKKGLWDAVQKETRRKVFRFFVYQEMKEQGKLRDVPFSDLTKTSQPLWL